MLKILGTEVAETLKSLGYILIIVVIHSIVKSISEGTGNNEIGEITYYVQYILIVTLIMTNFSNVVVLIKETINNLVGFINCLLPIMIALMMTTRKSSYRSSSTTNFIITYNVYSEIS
ncbi:MAG: hypothetical protein HFJ50_09645 [Clostridia bacterium]|nr:hypothetical protein [Clostridia bacterium]